MAQDNSTQPDWRQRALLGSGILALVLACGAWIYRALNVTPEEDKTSPAAVASKPDSAPAPKKARPEAEILHSPKGTPSASQAEPVKSFLDSFQDKSVGDSDTGPAASSAQLQKAFDALDEVHERFLILQEKLASASPPKESGDKELKVLQERLDKGVAGMEKELRRARQVRPKDPVPQWLTGELLIVIRAEPVLILPYFERALSLGLNNARIWASLARIQVGANQFAEALETATKAITLGPKDRYTWNAFKLAAFSRDQAGQVVERMHKVFPKEAPAWANLIRDEATKLQARLEHERQLRQSDEKANLPRVRFTIEHRRFVPSPLAPDAGARGKGQPTGKIESTGREEAIIELFEDQAPATVANFLALVGNKFYDGTRFYLAEPASLVAGGCPRTKNTDPSEDGSGGPGYFIPDEFKLPKARGHFRGSISMVNSGEPNSAGSRFLFSLVPQPWMDGRFTVFGRVIKGQEAIDRITQGRTHPEVAPFGRIIPGDLLVRAEILRKRNHEYQVIKAHGVPK
jgi:peptidyl-prolyl cis-trans isomerase B (cyclophilin B)